MTGLAAMPASARAAMPAGSVRAGCICAAFGADRLELRTLELGNLRLDDAFQLNHSGVVSPEPGRGFRLVQGLHHCINMRLGFCENHDYLQLRCRIDEIV